MIQTDRANTTGLAEHTRTLRALAIHSLARMYYPNEQLFAFRLRRQGEIEVLEGQSRRYTATALIGLAMEEPRIVSEVLGSHGLVDVCDRLLGDIDAMTDLGEVALTAWAARTLRHPAAATAIEALRHMEPGRRPYPTVERSWALTALTVEGSDITDQTLAKEIATTLMESFRVDSNLFPSGRVRGGRIKLAGHVSCFADFVYPVQALSRYCLATGDDRAGEIAGRCADHMCGLQGPRGQWWWHFDVRTGRVIERYPVYSVHQDSMAPMALKAAGEACGRDYSEAIAKGLDWLFDPPEKAGSLVDTDREIIWRKVARREPHKFVRGLQATASTMHPSFRIPAADLLFPPVAIDYETRPYHMGWILYAWPKHRLL